MRGGMWHSLGIGRHSIHRPLFLDIVVNEGSSAFVDAVMFKSVGKQGRVLSIKTEELGLAVVGDSYGEFLKVRGGVRPYRWEATRPLPEGLSIDEVDGRIHGKPRLVGKSVISLRVTDAKGASSKREFSFIVLPASEGGSRGHGTTSEDSKPVTTGSMRDVGSSPMAKTVQPTALDLIAASADGAWIKVNENLFSDVWVPAELRPLRGVSNPNPFKIIAAWSSFAWDSRRGDLILYGGGHANYAGNEVYRFRSSTRRWERASLPSEVVQDESEVFNAIDGADAAPSSAHTYDNSVYLEVADRFLTFGGAATDHGGPYQRIIQSAENELVGPYAFDPSKADGQKVGGTTGSHVQRISEFPDVLGGEMWQNRDIYRNVLSESGLPLQFVNCNTAYQNEAGVDVVYLAARRKGTTQRLYKYTVSNVDDPKQDTLELVGTVVDGLIGGESVAAFSPHLKAYVRSNYKKFSYWDLNSAGTKNRDKVFVPNDPTGELAELTGYGMDYDPIRRTFLVWPTGGDVWEVTPPEVLSPEGWEARKLVPAANTQRPYFGVGTGVLGKWKYAKDLGVFVALQDKNEGNVWFYKPHGWVDPRHDVDADGIRDDWESLYGLSASDPNDAWLDDDGDGLVNIKEFYASTDPTSLDSDGDGMPDGWEVRFGLDPLSSADAILDADQDGVSNLDEFINGTDPTRIESDTDGDGMPDAWESAYGLDPFNPADALEDPDADGLTNLDEFVSGTDPLRMDTDSDGMPDGWEISNGFDPLDQADGALDSDGDGLDNVTEYVTGTNPRSNDSDADGMPDGWEVAFGLSPLDASDALLDGDGDGLRNREEYLAGTDPLRGDTDGDGMPDGWEISNSLDPLDPADAASDPDGDGLTNLEEYLGGSDPWVAETGNPIPPGPDAANAVLKRTELNAEWRRVATPGSMADGVAIVSPLSGIEDIPGVVALSNVGGDGFDIRFRPWDYVATQPASTDIGSVGYFVGESGRYVSQGTNYEVGAANVLAPAGWHSVAFSSAFSGVPKVFVTIQDLADDAPPVVARVRNITSEGYEVALFYEESSAAPAQIFEVGYLALEADSSDLHVSADHDGDGISEDIRYGIFDHAVGTTWSPVFSSFVKLEEESSADPEVGHLDESLAIVSFGDVTLAQIYSYNESDTVAVRMRHPDASRGPIELGSMPTVPGGGNYIPLARDFADPILIVSHGVDGMDAPGAVHASRMVNSQGRVELFAGFKYWPYIANANAESARVHYMVVERGHGMISGTLEYEAADILAGEGVWRSVSLSQPVPSAMVFATVDVDRDMQPETAVTRVDAVSESGFKVRLQREQAATGVYDDQRVNWIAISKGVAVSPGLGRRLEIIKGKAWDKAIPFSFSAPFDGLDFPVALQMMQTKKGGDTATAEQDLLSADKVKVYVGEEQSLDAETSHSSEVFGILVTE